MAAAAENPKPAPASAEELEALAAAHGTPLQLYDGDGMVAGVTELQRAFADAGFDFTQFYAVKALPNPAILQLLVRAGCGLDCSSTAELYIARKLGVPGHRIMYTSNYTSKADLAWAVNQGVLLNLDDVSLVAGVAANGPFPETICFRLNPGRGRTDSSTVSNVLGGRDAKFGVPPEQIVDAYLAAQAAGATRFGMHMMTGSCVLSEEYWGETVTLLVRAMAQVATALGISQFDFLNIGGGMGVPYKPTERPVHVRGLVARLRRTLDSALAEVGLAPPRRLFMENGRWVTGPHGWLLARCHVVKRAFGGKYLGLDANMAHLMRPGMYGSYHHISVPAREGDERVATHVVGTLCENNDWFAKDRALPASAGVGDLVLIHDTGAHAASMGFQYNGKLRAPELLLRAGGRRDVIRARETLDVLYSNTALPSDLTLAGAQLDFSDGPTLPAAMAATPTQPGALQEEAAQAPAAEAVVGQRVLAPSSFASAVVGALVGGAAVAAMLFWRQARGPSK